MEGLLVIPRRRRRLWRTASSGLDTCSSPPFVTWARVGPPAVPLGICRLPIVIGAKMLPDQLIWNEMFGTQWHQLHCCHEPPSHLCCVDHLGMPRYVEIWRFRVSSLWPLPLVARCVCGRHFVLLTVVLSMCLQTVSPIMPTQDLLDAAEVDFPLGADGGMPIVSRAELAGRCSLSV